MKRLLMTTTALAVALTSAPPFPLMAQTLEADGRVTGPDGAVLCTPAEGAPCDLEAIVADLAAKAQQAAAAEAAAAEAAAAEAAAAEAAAAEAAAAEAAAAEAAAAAIAAAAAEAAAAEAAAREAAAAEAAAAEAAAAEAAAAAIAAAAAEAAAAEAAAAEAAKAAETPEVVTEEPAPEAATAAEAAPETRPEPRPETLTTETAPEVIPAPASPEVAATDPIPPATEATPEPTPEAVAEAPAPETVIPPAPEPEAVTTLEAILAPETPAEGAADAPPPAAALVEAPTTEGTAPPPEAAPTATTEVTITEADTRSSAQEFAAAPQADDRGRRGLSDLEKVGLVALGALVVGAILKNGDEVVSNTGDRVVVRRDDGSLTVLKDDDTLLRRPGSTVRTETFRDGSTRTVVERDDGSRIITIRDASGRVLRRARVDIDGRETLLIDDITPVQPIDVTTLPTYTAPPTISASGGGTELAAALAAITAREAARTFSLRQIREIRQVRALAPQVDVTPITFATGSSAIAVTEAEKLAALGRFIADTIRARPYEMFLIEGHTDAVGSDASNLTLSDRRAESLALALTEYFGVPPENLVVQGYGESDLLIPTTAAEPLNRRVAVRMISPLLNATR
jgi:outer membrane protein OmpA-like peptidoglycan-associated protein